LIRSLSQDKPAPDESDAAISRIVGERLLPGAEQTDELTPGPTAIEEGQFNISAILKPTNQLIVLHFKNFPA